MADRSMIEDLRKRVEARDRGETTGYGELQSLHTVLGSDVWPFLIGWESVRLEDPAEVPTDVEEEIKETRTLLGRLPCPNKYTKVIGDGNRTSFRIVHPFYTKDVVVHCFEPGTGFTWNGPASRGATFVDYEFKEPPKKNALVVTVLG